jgi:hypothetical protein
MGAAYGHKLHAAAGGHEGIGEKRILPAPANRLVELGRKETFVSVHAVLRAAAEKKFILRTV